MTDTSKTCKTCKWWDEAVTDYWGFCDNPQMSINAWHPQKLPDWLTIKIFAKLYPPPDFGCILHKQREKL